MKQQEIENGSIIREVLLEFGLNPDEHQIETFGSGLINCTWKLTAPKASYILQQINDKVFKRPQDITDNLRQLQLFLQASNPAYLFPAPLAAVSGKSIVIAENGTYFRLMPFVSGSHTVDHLQYKEQAYEAALQFGKFSRLLTNFNINKLNYTIPDFHNLTLRLEEFKISCAKAAPARLEKAKDTVQAAFLNSRIANLYKQLISTGKILLRVVHHDTKISNVLFDKHGKGLCVIDLDTVMPGFYLSDVGDMLRTCLSPAGEEERDLSKIQIREDFFLAIYKGYMQEMGKVLTLTEQKLFIYSGSMMIYMQALRFLTDYLNGDRYYTIVYPEQNLFRARNQFELLRQYNEKEERFKKLTNQ